jgi:prolyl oligopeptidase
MNCGYSRLTGRWAPAAVALVSTILAAGRAAADAGKPLAYPEAKKTDVVDEYHGVKVADPYRWMEDNPDESSALREWIEAQNKLTFAYLERIPQRDVIKERLTAIWDYPKYGLPYEEGGRYFFTKNDGLQNQDVLYTVKSFDDTPKPVVDPNRIAEDGTVSLRNWAPTDDGSLIAYSLATAGSDWNEIRVRHVESGLTLEDHVEWVKFSGISWLDNGSGFFYSRYDRPKEGEELKQQNYYHKLYFHKRGTPQSIDHLIYERPDEKEWGFGGDVTDDGRYLIINIWKGTLRKNLVFYIDLKNVDMKVVELINEFQAEWDFIDNQGSVFYFQTDLDAPRYRVVAIDTDSSQRGDWKEIVPQHADTLRSVDLVGGKLITTYMKDARSRVAVVNLDGTPVRDVPLPGLGSAFGFRGKADSAETFYTFTSFTQPGTVYRYNVETGRSDVLWTPKVDYDPDAFETRQVFYQSKDRTKVPMFITHKKGMKLDGSNPTLLYGYGGFNIPITPGFSPKFVVWMEMGGVYAVANLRGGGEYGKDWHEAGMKLKKQNVFDDFIAAAEWLIENKYTSQDKLAIHGGSNGGLLVGAAITQRPDLFAAALPAVGVMDMLRFTEFTIGWAWASDYGSPKDPEEFKALYAYSPLHHLKPGTAYPATLITTGDHDDRVHPAHSFKFAAGLQAAQSASNPTLIRIQTDAGHGAGKPTSFQIEEVADMWAFLVKNLDMKVDLRADASISRKPAGSKPSG